MLLFVVTVQAQFDKAWEYQHQSKFDSAIAEFEKVIPTVDPISDFNKQSMAYIGLSNAQYYRYQYRSIIDNLNDYLSGLPQAIKDTSDNVSRLYTYLAVSHFNLGDYANSYKEYKNAERLALNIDGSNKENIYSSLARVCIKRSDFEQSEEYLKKIIALYKKQNTPIEKTYKSELELMRIKILRGQLIEAQKKGHELLMRIERNVSPLKQGKLINSIYWKLSKTHLEMNNYDSSIWYANQVKQVTNRGIINLNGRYLHNYLAKNDIGKAQYYIDECFRILAKNQTNRVTWGKTYLRQGLIYEKKNEYNKALNSIQQGLQFYFLKYQDDNIYSNPSLEWTNSEDALLYALTYKARVFGKLAMVSQDEKDCKMTVETHQLTMRLMDKMRQQFEAQGSKSFLASRFWWVFEEAIKSCVSLHEMTGDAKYLEYAFQFVEKSKAVLVQDAVYSTLAERQNQLPDSLTKYEHDLKVQVTYLENKLFNAERKKSEKADNIRSELLLKREELRRFGLRVRDEYPKYFDMKYNHNLVDVASIQNSLSKNQAAIEYFIGDSTIYVFSISRDDLAVQEIPSEGKLVEQVRTLREGLDPKKQSIDITSYLTFTSQAHGIYQKYVKPVVDALPKGIEKLTFITDGELAYVPFEVLLTSPADPEVGDYRTPNYLIKEFEINYAYSASLMHSKLKEMHGVSEMRVAAFAPSYPKNVTDSSQVEALGSFRDQITSLRWNTKEVEAIGDYLPISPYMREEATEAKFKEVVQEYPVVHLAMHALVDDENPMNSRLAFTNVNDNQEDNFLNAYELCNMKLNASLAVLSACNTGHGKYVRGEGVVSLGQAFALAGCPSLVISHWSVDDKATSMLMNSFYEGLAGGLDKSRAMHLAKLNYLENAGPRQANPMYWGSFVLIGDDTPIISSSIWWFWGLASIALLIGIMWFVKKRSVIS